jgi:hypothetical protein
MSTSTTTPAGGLVAGGGLPPLPRSASITVTQRTGGRVVVATWDTCHGVADFVTNILGAPGARVETEVTG